jgi:hypothetical protein
MNRLAVLIALLGLTAAHACLAEEPAFCKSMCASEQRECKADARDKAENESFAPVTAPDKNPFARTAQGQVRTTDARALETAGYQSRRLAGAGACDTAYQRCTRSCEQPQNAGGADKARHQAKQTG